MISNTAECFVECCGSELDGNGHNFEWVFRLFGGISHSGTGPVKIMEPREAKELPWCLEIPNGVARREDAWTRTSPPRPSSLAADAAEAV